MFCSCALSLCPDYAAACDLLSSLCWKFSRGICCSLRPPSLRLCCGEAMDAARELRVWPGAGGLELFRLQLGALLGGPVDPDRITFVIEDAGHVVPLVLPGLANYGVASYCAAIGAALRTCTTSSTGTAISANTAIVANTDVSDAEVRMQPDDRWSAPHDPKQQQQGGLAAATGDGSASAAASAAAACSPGGCNDEWIELLCSVADLLEGEGGPAEEDVAVLERKTGTVAVAAAASGAGAPVVLRVCVCVDAAAPAGPQWGPSAAAVLMPTAQKGQPHRGAAAAAVRPALGLR